MECRDNELTELPKLPKELKYLDCSNNPITKIIGELPEKIVYLRIDNITLLDNETIQKLSSYINRPLDKNSLLNEDLYDNIFAIYDNERVIEDNVDEFIKNNNLKLREDVMIEMQKRRLTGGRSKNTNKKTKKNRRRLK